MQPLHAAATALVLLIVYNILRPFIALYSHLRRARTVGLPIKVLPVPQGLFSFFAFQLLRRLPFPRLHALLNVGRPEGYAMHAEMGDVFLTVNPTGISLVVADPALVAHVAHKRAEFPKPPNTGAIINIYGRNVINADGDTWRLHRRVTGPAFSERIHRAVWRESTTQAQHMLRAWHAANPSSRSSPTSPLLVPTIGDDALRLGLNVITGAAYGTPLSWSDTPAQNPPFAPLSPRAAPSTPLSYRGAVAQLTAHLMPLFLTPRWLLRAAPRASAWGRAQAAYDALGGYMRGMLLRQRALLAAGETDGENLLTALIRAQGDDPGDDNSNATNATAATADGTKGERRMRADEVLGNAFIFLFAGHETTANTLHYALLLLALHADVQARVLAEVDAMYARAAAAGRDGLEYDADFGRARWIVAVMYETLRVYTPTGVTNKWTAGAQALRIGGRTHVVPAGTRVVLNGTGVHCSPSVWGADAGVWRPRRWIVRGGVAGEAVPITPPPERSGDADAARVKIVRERERGWTPPLTPPPSPPSLRDVQLAATQTPTPSREQSRSRSEVRPQTQTLHDDQQRQIHAGGAATHTHTNANAHMHNENDNHEEEGEEENENHEEEEVTLLKPAPGTFLPFSEGARACSGKKFATVEFVAVLCALLRERRVVIATGPVADSTGGKDGHVGEVWSEERARRVLAGRKAGALTLQPPEDVPLLFVRR